MKSFNDGSPDNIELPKSMNNAKFRLLLPIWKERVIEKQDPERKKVLEKQHQKIDYCYDFRNALAHGMWEWSKSEPEKITAIRIIRKEIKYTHFTFEVLEQLGDQIGEIYYNVKYPGGIEDQAKAMAEEGFYMSRRFVCAMTDNPKTKDLFPDISKILNEPESSI